MTATQTENWRVRRKTNRTTAQLFWFQVGVREALLIARFVVFSYDDDDEDSRLMFGVAAGRPSQRPDRWSSRVSPLLH